MKAKVKAAWYWVKGNVVALLVCLGALLTLGFFIKRERRKRLSAEAQLEVERLRTEIATATEARRVLLESADKHKDRIEELDKKIEGNERAIVEHFDGHTEEMSHEEIRNRLRRLFP